MRINIIIYVLAIFLYNCTPKYECVTKKIYTPAPTGDTRSFFGYKLNDVAKFKTTDGDTVTMTCVKDTIRCFWSPSKLCDNNKCVCEETMYWITSNSFNFTINKDSILNLDGDSYTLTNRRVASIQYFDKHWESFNYNTNCNNGVCFNLNVNGKLYKNVMKIATISNQNNPKKVDTIYYNIKEGIIKFSFVDKKTEWIKL